MRSVLALLALSAPAAAPAASDAVAQGRAAPRAIPCYCTDAAGERVDLGREICLVVDGRAFMARCEMALNNPIWRDTGAGCVSSSLQGGAQAGGPVLEPGAVDAEIALSEAQS